MGLRGFRTWGLHLPDSKTGAKIVHIGPPALGILANIECLPDNPWVITGKKSGARGIPTAPIKNPDSVADAGFGLKPVDQVDDVEEAGAGTVADTGPRDRSSLAATAQAVIDVAQRDAAERETHYRSVLLALSSAPTLDAARAIVTMELGMSANASDDEPLILVAAE